MSRLTLLAGVHGDPLKDSISVSSDSSEAVQGGSDYVPEDIVIVPDAKETMTDTDDVKIIEKPPKKRIRSWSLFHLPSENSPNNAT